MAEFNKLTDLPRVQTGASVEDVKPLPARGREKPHGRRHLPKARRALATAGIAAALASGPLSTHQTDSGEKASSSPAIATSIDTQLVAHHTNPKETPADKHIAAPNADAAETLKDAGMTKTVDVKEKDNLWNLTKETLGGKEVKNSTVNPVHAINMALHTGNPDLIQPDKKETILTKEGANELAKLIKTDPEVKKAAKDVTTAKDTEEKQQKGAALLDTFSDRVEAQTPPDNPPPNNNDKLPTWDTDTDSDKDERLAPTTAPTPTTDIATETPTPAPTDGGDYTETKPKLPGLFMNYQKRIFTDRASGTTEDTDRHIRQQVEQRFLPDVPKEKLPTLDLHEKAITEENLANPESLQERVEAFSEFIQKVTDEDKKTADKVAEGYYEAFIKELKHQNIDIPSEQTRNKAQALAGILGLGLLAFIIRKGVTPLIPRLARRERAYKATKNKDSELAKVTSEYTFYNPTLNVHYKMGVNDFGLPKFETDAPIAHIRSEEIDANKNLLLRGAAYAFGRKNLLSRLRHGLPLRGKKFDMVFKQLEALGLIKYDPTQKAITRNTGNSLKVVQASIRDKFHPHQRN